ncbi:hypothetical protein REPUB_Repub15cG0121500 [Reevesia pubescens]
MSDPYKKRILFTENSSGYLNDWVSQFFMKSCPEHYLLEGQAIVGKALQSSDDFHFEPSITKLEERDYPLDSAEWEFERILGSHVVVAICLQNHYTIDDVYVVELFSPTTKRKNAANLPSVIFNDLKNMKKKFVTPRVHGTEVGFQEEALSNIPQGTITMTNASSTTNFLNSDTIRYMNTIEPKDDHAMETEGINEQGRVKTQGPYEQVNSEVHAKETETKNEDVDANSIIGPTCQSQPALQADPNSFRKRKRKEILSG